MGPVPPHVWLERWESEYREKTGASRELFARSAGMHVNGVSHNIRYFDPYPFAAGSAEGSAIRDVDGNEYTDYWMGHWAMILGHRPKPVESAIIDQARKGWMYGTFNRRTVELSEAISGAVPAAERIRYVASGTEAAMYAVRLARAATGRRIIAKVDGGWHGYTSDLLKTVNWPFSVPESTGMVNDQDIVSVPYNDIPGATSILDGVRGELAGIIAEPLLGGGGCIPADPDYLRALQEFARSSGALFMLDEIVTGFRFGFGCLYQEMGLDPDILTLGKVVGGGMPVGAVCGREEVMRLCNTSEMSREDRCYVGGGTFSANPVTMAAGAATLKVLKESPIEYERIGALGRRARDELGRILGPGVAVTGRGSLFMTHFLADGINVVRNAADAARCDQDTLRQYHMYLMGCHGIFFLPGKLGAISTAHASEDVERLAAATREFVAGASSGNHSV